MCCEIVPTSRKKNLPSLLRVRVNHSLPAPMVWPCLGFVPAALCVRFSLFLCFYTLPACSPCPLVPVCGFIDVWRPLGRATQRPRAALAVLGRQEGNHQGTPYSTLPTLCPLSAVNVGRP